MKSKKEQLLLKLQTKNYKLDFKLTFLLHTLIWVRKMPTSKGACSKLFAAWTKHPHLGTTLLGQQTHIKKMVILTDTWLPPLAGTAPILDNVRLWSKKGKDSKPGAGRDTIFWAYHRYQSPQKKHSAILFMLRMHLKQLKIFMRSIKNVIPTVLLPLTCVAPTYLYLGTTLLPPGQTSVSHTRCMGSGMGVRGKDNPPYGILSWGFVQKRFVSTCTWLPTLVSLTDTIGLCPVGTKLLGGKSSSSQGSRVSKVSLPKVRSSKKNNLPKGDKVAYTQEDLVKKASHFINIWCYIQMIFFFFHTLKQPMVIVAYSNFGCRAVNSLPSTTYFLLPKGCFLIGVKKFGCYPWRRHPQRFFIPTGLLSAYARVGGLVKGVKVEVLALSFLPQLKLEYLKGWLLTLEERVSKANLPRVREASLLSSICKKKTYVGLFRTQKISSPQINNFYKYLGFCDYIIFKVVWKWCSRKHSNQSAQWIRCHYFYSLNGQSWVFALKKIVFNPTAGTLGRHNRM